MSAAHPEEDLIDYEEDDTTTTAAAGAATGNGTAAAGADGAAAGTGAEQKEQKGSYVGIHSTGFRDFLLKPELLRAISDLGFEHPSEGERTYDEQRPSSGLGSVGRRRCGNAGRQSACEQARPLYRKGVSRTGHTPKRS